MTDAAAVPPEIAPLRPSRTTAYRILLRADGWLTHEQIADRADFDIATVSNATQELDRLGIVERAPLLFTPNKLRVRIVR